MINKVVRSPVFAGDQQFVRYQFPTAKLCPLSLVAFRPFGFAQGEPLNASYTGPSTSLRALSYLSWLYYKELYFLAVLLISGLTLLIGTTLFRYSSIFV